MFTRKCWPLDLLFVNSQHAVLGYLVLPISVWSYLSECLFSKTLNGFIHLEGEACLQMLSGELRAACFFSVCSA